MDIVKILRSKVPAKHLPQFDQAIAALNDPKVRKYLEDKEIANDINVISNEAVNTMKKFGATTQDEGLKQIFNLAAGTAVPLATEYVLKGDLSFLSKAQAAKAIPKAFLLRKTFEDVVKRKDPVIHQLLDALQNNQTAIDAALRIAVKTNGDLFKLEKDAKGQGYIVDLTTGSGLKFPIEKPVYDEAVALLATAKKGNPPPKPGA